MHRTLSLLGVLLSTVTLPAQVTLNVPAQYATVQAAINAAQTGDTVLVAPGTYTGTALALTVDFLGKAITVRSAQGPGVTTLTTPFGRVVTFASGEGAASVLEGFTINGGNGGVLCHGASPTIRACVIANNTGVMSGGGVRIVADGGQVASPLIEDCRIELNGAFDHGAGISVEVDGGVGSPTLRRCSIANNVALDCHGGGEGAGASFTRQSGVCQPLIEECRVQGNSTIGKGGGLGFTSSPAVVSRCDVRNNFAGSSGGGLFCWQSAVTIENCMVVDNIANGPAVVLVSNGVPAIVRSCTIAGNASTGSGNAGLSVGPYAIVENSIIWTATGAAVWGNSSGTNLTMTYSNYSSAALPSFNATNTSVDPLFVDPANGDYHLSPQSPCVDAGNPNPAMLPPLDYEGDPRVAGAALDIGADETPVPALPGTGEDLALFVWVGGAGDPNANTVTAASGVEILARFRSPGGSFNGAPGLLVAQGFQTGSPPAPNPGLGDLHINLFSPYTVLTGTLSPAPFPVAGLPAAGTDVTMMVPPGLSGNSARLQAFVITPAANNGQYVATNAHDIDFQ